MSGFTVDTKAFDVLNDEKGAISGFVIHVGKINLKIQAVENQEADKRTASVLLVWLSKNAKEISDLLQTIGCKLEGEITVNIMPLSTLKPLSMNKKKHVSLRIRRCGG